MHNRLLIADGDPELSDIYRHFFTHHGYEVETANGGVECLVKLRSRPVTHLILDLEIPGGGGEGVLACMREEFPAHYLPVVLMTSHPLLKEVGMEHVQHPVVACLQKPCLLDDLLECIQSTAGQSKAAFT
jgi:DNA-binding NtrC family response regulator